MMPSSAARAWANLSPRKSRLDAAMTAASPADIESAQIMLANPRGFCAGVERAIEIVERVLRLRGAPVFVKHEIVHNRFVCDSLRARGVVFIEDPRLAEPGRPLVYSAHGVSKAVQDAARARGLEIFDATCPLVVKVHAEVARLRRDGFAVVMIGHRGHPEVEGTLGQASGGVFLVETEADIENLQIPDPQKIAFVTQTTLSVDDTADIVAALRRRFPDARAPSKGDICYATQNRQDAIKKMAAQCDLILVVGSPASSNSNRLVEVAEKAGCRARLIDSAAAIDAQLIDGAQRIGVTAGASAPESLVRGVVAELQKERPGARAREISGVEETVVFSLPGGLRRARA